jgi:hypothetical protein
MVGRTRIAGVGIVFAVALAAPRLARAGVELSARMPVGVAVSDATRFELGLRSDLLMVSRAGLGLGLVGEVRSVSLSQRGQEIGGTIAWLPDQGRHIALGPVLDAGYGTQGSRRYSFERLSLQLRGRLGTDDLSYAATSGIFVGARQTVSGPGATEWIVGVDIGGGLIASWFLLMNAIVGGG